MAYLSHLPKVSRWRKRLRLRPGWIYKLLKGTGLSGRIMKTDVERILHAETPTPAPETVTSTTETESLNVFR